MSRPIARPIASRTLAQPSNTGGEFQPVSAANGSLLGHPLRISATRLDYISSRLADGDWQALNFISECRLASGKQLVRRFWQTRDRDTSAARAGRRAFKRLADWRVLDPLPIRAVGGLHGGSDTIVYGVGVAGVKLLARRGHAQKRLGIPGERYAKHTLACTELVVALHEASRNRTLELIEPPQSEPACWRDFIGAGGSRIILKADLFVRVGAGSANEDRWLIEVDLATEASTTIRAKADRHLAYYRSGSETVHPRVLWAVPDARRAEQIAEVLRHLPAPAERLFSICLLDDVVGFVAAEASS
jgi:protein involved in plasmid replication-relaxation